MATAQDTLTTVLKLEGEAQHTAGLDRTAAAANRAAKAQKDLQDTSLALAATGAAVTGSLLAMTKAAGEYGRVVYDSGVLRTGMAGEQITGLKFAAQQAGVGFDTLLRSLNLMSRSAMAAQKGSGPVADAYKKLGVTVTDASGHLKPMHNLILEVAQGLSQMDNAAERGALSIPLLGRGGALMLPLMRLRKKQRKCLEKLRATLLP